MKLKNLKRFLSIALSAAMAVSMISVPAKAEGLSDEAPAVVREAAENPDEELDEEDPDGSLDEQGDSSEEVKGKDISEEAKGEEAPLAEENAGAPQAQSADAAPAADEESADVIKVTADKSFKQAVEEAQAGSVKTIQLATAENADVPVEAGVYDLSGLTIETDGRALLIDGDVTFKGNASTTVKNSQTGVSKWMFRVTENGKLNLADGGNYTTKGPSMMRVLGEVEINGATLKCDGTYENTYGSKQLISLSGVNAVLYAKSGTINADLGDQDSDGLYAVAVFEGARVIFGEKGANNASLVVTSRLPIVGMNNGNAPADVTVYSGTFTNTFDPSGASDKKYACVFYFSGTAKADIQGGQFTQTGKEGHIFSMPWTNLGGNDDTTKPAVNINVSITNGEFASKGKIFDGAAVPNAEKDTNAKITITGGKFSDGLDNVKFGPEGNGTLLDGDSFVVGTKKVVDVGIVANDGTFTAQKSFSTLADAIAFAGEGADAKTIKLAADIELTQDLGAVKIETDGHRITVPEGQSRTVKGATITNSKLLDTTSWKNSRNLIFYVLGNLTIDGGTYKTDGAQALYVKGEATVKGEAKIETTAESSETSSIQGVPQNYDGAALVVVDAGGKLTVGKSTVTATSTESSSGSDYGMYGFYVLQGGELVLGTEEGGPTTTATMAAVGMNATTAPGKITINDGTYTSHCVSSTQKWNAVIYLPATAEVTINGGTFTAATGSNTQIISVPYESKPDGSGATNLKLLINGGNFNASGSNDSFVYNNGATQPNTAKNTIMFKGGSFNVKPQSLKTSGFVAGCSELPENATEGRYVLVENPCTISWVKEKAPTCWEEGVIGHYECEKCFTKYNTKTQADGVLATETVIPKKVHGLNYEEHEKVAATCTEDGWEKCVECLDCHNYYSDTKAMLNAEKPNTTEANAAFVAKKTGHTFKGTDGKVAATIDTEAFEAAMKADPSAFKDGQANGVTATLKCQTKGCEYVENATSVKVVYKDSNSNLTGYDCTTGKELTYTVTAEFEAKDAKEEAEGTAAEETPAEGLTATQDVTVKIDGKAHTYEEGTVTFTWGEDFDIASFKEGVQDKVTVTSGKCTVCGKDVKPFAYVTYKTDADRTSVLTCKNSKTLTAKAVSVVTDKDGNVTNTYEVAGVEQEDKVFRGTHNLGNYQKYVAPTCTTTGRWGFYTCKDCSRWFLGEDSAAADEDITNESQLVIPKVKHSFGATPTFSWIDADKKEAKATFRCSSCKKEVDVMVKAADLSQTNTTDATCGKEVEEQYSAKVTFNPDKVEEAEDGSLSYPQTATGGIDCTGTLKRIADQPHEIEWSMDAKANAPVVTWMSKKTAEDVSTADDIAKGVKVVLTCKRCKQTLTIEKNNVTGSTGFTSNLDGIFAATSIVKDTEKSTPANCQNTGNDVYNVKVAYDFYYGDGRQTKELGTISAKTAVDSNAHVWGGSATGSWTAVMLKDSDGNDTDKPKTVHVEVPETMGSAIKVERDVPVYKYSMDTKCTVCDRATKTLEGELGGSTGDLKVLLDQTQTNATLCSTDGVYTYTVTLPNNGGTKTYKKSEEAPGHQTQYKIEWDKKIAGENLVTGFNKVTGRKYCKRCEEAIEKDAAGEVTYQPSDYYEPIVRSSDVEADKPHIEITYENNNITNCGKPVSQVVKAVIDLSDTPGSGRVEKRESTLTIDSYIKGHKPVYRFEWTPVKGEGEEEASITKETQWTVVAKEYCANEGCECNVSNAGTANDKPVEVSTDDKSTLVVEVAYDTEHSVDPTETKEGTYVWNLTLKDNDKKVALVTEGADANALADQVTHTETISAKGPHTHKYGATTATVAKEITVAEDGTQTAKVTLSRTCTDPECPNKDEAGKVIADTKELIAAFKDYKQADGSFGATAPADCAAGFTARFELTAAQKTELADEAGGKIAWTAPTGVANWDAYAAEVVVAAKTDGTKNHVLHEIAASADQSCMTSGHPAYFECYRCEKAFTDATAATEYTGIKEGDTAKVPHEYDLTKPEITIVDPAVVDDTSAEGTAVQLKITFTCKKEGCTEAKEGHTKTLTAVMVADSDYDASKEVYKAKKVDTVPAECEDSDDPKGGIGTATYTYSFTPKAEDKVNNNLDAVITNKVTRQLKPVDHKYGANDKCEYCGAEKPQETCAEAGHLYTANPIVTYKDGKVMLTFHCTRPNCAIGAEGNTKEVETSAKKNEETSRPASCPEGNDYEGQGLDVYDYEWTAPAKTETQKDQYGTSTATQGQKYTGIARVEIPAFEHDIDADGKCTLCKNQKMYVLNLDADGVVYSSTAFAEISTDTATMKANISAAIPVAPTKVGFKASGWKYGETEYATADKEKLVDALATALTAVNPKAQITFQYTELTEAQKGTGEVQARSGYTDAEGYLIRIDSDDDVREEVVVGSNLVVTAADTKIVDGKTYKFSHWADKNQKVLGYTKDYRVRISQRDETQILYRMYVPEETEVEAKPTAAITSKSVLPDVKKMQYVTTFNLPEGYTFKNSGYVYSTERIAGDDLVLGGANVKSIALNGTKTATLTIKVKDGAEDNVWYIKGYLTCTDKDGKEVTVYTDMEAYSYNQLSAQQ